MSLSQRNWSRQQVSSRLRSAPHSQITNSDCISLLYTVWGFWGKNRPSAAKAKSRKMLEPQGEAKRAPPGKTPVVNYETVALPLSYIGLPIFQLTTCVEYFSRFSRVCKLNLHGMPFRYEKSRTLTDQAQTRSRPIASS